MIIATVPVEFATRNEGTFIDVVRNRRNKVTRAYLKFCPGFFRHIVASFIDRTDGPDGAEIPIPARYGMAREQQLSCGHVYSLCGTVGSGDAR